MIESLLTEIIGSLPAMVIALIIFIVFWLLARLSASVIQKISTRYPLQKQPLFLVLSTFCKTTILVIGIITALGSAGLNVSALVASFSLSGFALTFATKDAFANLLAGILVLLYQPFKIGDIIGVGNVKGEVIQMSLRYTHLKAEDREVLIPNSSLLTNSISIFTT